jgi:predicted nuclease of restriction endonuclease-like RecB superfamily
VVWREFMGELAALFKDAWPESQHQLLEEVSDIEIRNKMDSVMEGLSKLMK